jgi:DNA-directed RNA polymerase specialized sigma24 family protein
VNRRVQNDSTPSDFELVERSRQGDANAFGELVNRHYHRCAKLAEFILRDRTGARDEVQKACQKAFEHLDQYRATAAFATWLSRIVINECRMALRANGGKQLTYLDGLRAGLDILPLPAQLGLNVRWPRWYAERFSGFRVSCAMSSCFVM